MTFEKDGFSSKKTVVQSYLKNNTMAGPEKNCTKPQTIN